MVAHTEVSICEMALRRIGVAQRFEGVTASGTLADCTDTHPNKLLCDVVYPEKRDIHLESFPWQPFRAYERLVLFDDNVNDSTDVLHPWGQEWRFAYRFPAGMLRMRRFVNDSNWRLYRGWYWDSYIWPWQEREWAFVIREHEDDKIILTDVAPENADAEFTKAVTDATRFQGTWADALGWLVAAELALVIAVDAQNKGQMAAQMYEQMFWKAAALAKNEEIPYPEGDEHFIRSRGGR